MGLMDRLRIDGKVAIVTGAGRGVARQASWRRNLLGEVPKRRRNSL